MTCGNQSLIALNGCIGLKPECVVELLISYLAARLFGVSDKLVIGVLCGLMLPLQRFR